MRNWVNCWKPTANMVMVISSQANEAIALEGSETSSRAKAVMLPRVPSTPLG